MADETAVSRSVLADQVKDRLLQDDPGGPLPARIRGSWRPRVARELGTSQAPVREALRGLEALGVVEIRRSAVPGCGAHPRPSSSRRTRSAPSSSRSVPGSACRG